MRPTCFRIPYVTTRHLPYSPGEISCNDKSLDGGVLAKGQTVWLMWPHEERSSETIVPAFVEHLGVIALDVRFLVDLGKHVTRSLQEWKEPTSLLDKEVHEASSFTDAK